ncbi:MAG: hypothetical protein AAFR26_14610 [Cyanobacteria bacterium J06626_4]
MEALAIIFVICIFLALLAPEKKSRPPTAGDTLLKGLKAAVKDIQGSGGGGGGGGSKGGSGGFLESPWSVIFLTVLLGLLVTSLM